MKGQFLQTQLTNGRTQSAQSRGRGKHITVKEDRRPGDEIQGMIRLQRESLTSRNEGSASPQKSSPGCTFSQSPGLRCCLLPRSCQTVEGETDRGRERAMINGEKQDNETLWTTNTVKKLSACIFSPFFLFFPAFINTLIDRSLINWGAFLRAAAVQRKPWVCFLVPWSPLLTHVNYSSMSQWSTPQREDRPRETTWAGLERRKWGWWGFRQKRKWGVGVGKEWEGRGRERQWLKLPN